MVFTDCHPLEPLTNKFALAGIPLPLVPVEFVPFVFENVKVGVPGEDSKSCEAIVVCPITPLTPSSITKANALSSLKMLNLVLVGVGFLNVFVLLPLVAVV